MAPVQIPEGIDLNEPTRKAGDKTTAVPITTTSGTFNGRGDRLGSLFNEFNMGK
ncbi:MAG: hypothetical protein P8P56_05635 [Yoonia sp.]|nr:hypothetical protein [Yoonia sp.]